MYAFTFHRPTTIDQVTSLLVHNEEAAILAGGHSLIPVMKQRLAGPAVLVDLSTVEGLIGIEQQPGSITIGVMTIHAAVASSPVVQQQIPALAALAGGIGDPQVRHRGTIGGSIANNDPSADYPAACLGLGATIHTSKRTVTADEFFQRMFTTALEADEVITKVQFPIPDHAAYQKFKQPASGFALVGVFVSKRGDDIRVAVTGAGADGVFRVPQFEAALKRQFVATAIDGIAVSADGLSSDFHAGAEYRAHLIGALARRAVADAIA